MKKVAKKKESLAELNGRLNLRVVLLEKERNATACRNNELRMEIGQLTAQFQALMKEADRMVVQVNTQNKIIEQLHDANIKLIDMQHLAVMPTVVHA